MTNNATFMMVNPFDLVIDLPVDEAHVKELEDSLRLHGKMLEPVQVWLKDMRISNGFHRTTAAQRLEWSEIPCMVNDWTEDEFWDARIIAAKPHKTVEDKRLAQWCFESWKQSFGDEILSPDDVARVFKKFGIEPTDDDISPESLLVYTVMEAIYSADFSESVRAGEKEIIVKDAIGRKRRKYEPLWAERNLTKTEQWFKEKASRWGVPALDIRQKLLMAVGLPSQARMYLPTKSFIATVAASRQLKEASYLYFDGDNVHFHDWVSDVSSDKIDGVSYDEYFAKIESERKAEEEAKAEKERIEYGRKLAYWDSPQGKAEAEKKDIERRTENITRWLGESIERIEWAVNNAHGVPDAPSLFAKFAQDANGRMGKELVRVDALAAYNARLRDENERLKERVASLERALSSKVAVSERLASVVATSPAN